MKYPDELKGFISSNFNLTPVNAELARLAIKKHPNPNYVVEDVRKLVSYLRKKNTLGNTKSTPVKRLFFDIETSYCIVKNVWRPSYKGIVIRPDMIMEHAKIICISYKWEGDDKVYNMKWSKEQCDKQMMIDFIQIMNKADEVVGHNSDRFDEKWIRTRCLFHRIPAFPKYKSFDTLKKVRTGFNFPSNKLDEIGKYLGIGQKIVNERGLWDKVILDDDRKALQRMVDYCDQDVILLEDIFNVINPYVYNNTNFAVLKGGEKHQCPECGSPLSTLVKTTTTQAGTIKRLMECDSCEKNYFINNKNYQNYLKAKSSFNV